LQDILLEKGANGNESQSRKWKRQRQQKEEYAQGYHAPCHYAACTGGGGRPVFPNQEFSVREGKGLWQSYLSL
jgi:hypothetical protein